MKTSHGIIAMGLALGLTLSLATPSDAARREALNGNTLITDGSDIYAFPQLTLDHVNLVRIVMGADAATGEGRFIFGTKEFAMSLSANRSDLTVNGNSPFGSAMALQGADGPKPWTVADLNFAFDLGGDTAGVRVGIANGGSTEANENVDATGDGQLVFLLGGGYSTRSETMDMDLGARLAFASYSSVSDGEAIQGGSNIDLGVGARVFMAIDDELSLGILGGFTLNSWGIRNENTDDNEESSAMAWSLNLAAGPVYKIKDKATVAGYGGIALVGGSDEPNTEVDDDESSSFHIVIPHVNLATEVWVFDWMAVRAGVGYNYNIQTTAEVASAVQTAEHAGNFAWTAGVGFKVDDFKFDGLLQSAWLTEGPDMIGGDSTLFAKVAMLYSF